MIYLIQFILIVCIDFVIEFDRGDGIEVKIKIEDVGRVLFRVGVDDMLVG